MKRIGVFGGSFDPVHLGHLILAERALEQLSLDHILFVPAYLPPHKADGRAISSGENRVAMINLCIDGCREYSVCELELEREGLSYTVDTLEVLGKRYPECELVLLMGSDNARDFRSWKEPGEILRMATIGVWERPGEYFWPEIFPDHIPQKIQAPLMEISSTEIRARVARGSSIRFMTPSRVVSYIRDEELYG